MPDRQPLPPERVAELREVFHSLPHNRAMGLEVVELETDRAVLRLPYRAEQAGDPETGIVHGGVVTSLVDTCSGMAAFASQTAETAIATLDLRIDHMGYPKPGEALVCDARVYRKTRNVVFVRATVCQDGQAGIIAHSVSTFMAGSVGFVATRPEERP